MDGSLVSIDGHQTYIHGQARCRARRPSDNGAPCRRTLDGAVRALRTDLASGRWIERNQQITGLDEADFGGRLLIA
jgi:hypothetical protein